MELRAKIRGRVVTYFTESLFIVEQRKGRRGAFLSVDKPKPTIQRGLSTLHKHERRGHQTRLVAAYKGRLSTLALV